MAVFKCEMIFNMLTTAGILDPTPNRDAGWTESWYLNASDFAQAKSIFIDPSSLLDKRAGMLPTSATISGQRIQQVSPVGPTKVFNRSVRGSTLLQNDVPQMALEMVYHARGVLNVRRIQHRGVPDARIVGGLYFPSAAYTAAIAAWYAELFNYSFPGIDLSKPKLAIRTITDTGLVTLKVASPYVVGTKVRITRSTQNSTGRQRGEITEVLSVGPAANQFTVMTWEWGAASGGSVREDALIYANVDPAQIDTPQATTRKAGRPFNLYRGRVAKLKA